MIELTLVNKFCISRKRNLCNTNLFVHMGAPVFCIYIYIYIYIRSISGQFSYSFFLFLFVCSSISNTYIPRRRFDVCSYRDKKKGERDRREEFVRSK